MIYNYTGYPPPKKKQKTKQNKNTIIAYTTNYFHKLAKIIYKNKFLMKTEHNKSIISPRTIDDQYEIQD